MLSARKETTVKNFPKPDPVQVLDLHIDRLLRYISSTAHIRAQAVLDRTSETDVLISRLKSQIATIHPTLRFTAAMLILQMPEADKSLQKYRNMFPPAFADGEIDYAYEKLQAGR